MVVVAVRIIAAAAVQYHLPIVKKREQRKEKKEGKKNIL